MDILDDITNLFRTLLDYMGFDVEHLGRFLHPLPHRHASIRNRNLVRRIGSRLPLKPAKRIRIQNVFVRGPDPPVRNDSFCSDLSYLSSGGDNLVWMEEDLGNNCIMVRPRDRMRTSSPDRLPLDDMEESSVFIPASLRMDDRTSTPLDSSMGSVSADPFTHQKIAALEDELSNLRSQIAGLIQDQDKNRTLSVPDIVPGTSAAIPPAPPPPFCLPPPPPPAPPPPPPTPSKDSFKAPKGGKTLAELLKANKENLSTVECTGGSRADGPPSMTDVLKGLGTVKLRSIQRSPGGTPMKDKRPRSCDNSDPASLIAMALKKKFASRMLMSPRSPDVDRDDSSSPESPSMPFGQHFLKKTKKRSLLFDKRTSTSPRSSASPLQERNQ